MGRRERRAFRRAVGRLDRPALAAFVADLWSARGWEVAVEGGDVVATDRGSGVRRVLAIEPAGSPFRRRPRSPARESADALVAIRRPMAGRLGRRSPDDRVLDGDDLYEIVTYAIDRRTRDDLLGRHLGASADELAAPPGGRLSRLIGGGPGVERTSGDAHGLDLAVGPAGRAILAVALVAALMIAGVAANWPAVGPSPDAGVPVTTPGGDLAVAATATQTPQGSSTPTARPAEPTPSPVGPGFHPPVSPLGADRAAWTMFGGDAARTGAVPGIDGPRAGVLESARLDMDYPLVSSVAVVDGRAVVSHYDGNAYGLDASTLSVDWRTRLGDASTSSPTVVDGVAYVGVIRTGAAGPVYGPEAPETFFAVDAATGSVRWGAPIGSVVFSSAAVEDGLVYVGTREGDVVALDADTGARRWNTSVGPHVMSSPAVAGGLVYIGSSDGGVTALDSRTGAVRWHVETGRIVVSTPAVRNGTVYVGSGDRHLYALDAASGDERWRVELNSSVRSSPAVGDGTVYIGSQDGTLYAVGAESGAVRWRSRMASAVSSSPVLANDTIYVGSRGTNPYAAVSDNHVVALDAATGEVRWRFETAGPVLASPAVVADAVVIGDIYGRLYLLAACDAPGTDEPADASLAGPCPAEPVLGTAGGE